MRQLVECVPNFSEGRRPEIVEQIAEAIRSVPGVRVLDVESDADHNRSVITFVGSPAAAEEAAFRSVARAAQLIDLDQHQGEHPRMGAADVVPIVPLAGVTMDDCVAIAHRLGQRIGQDLEIPVYLYEEAATRPDRRNLADVRRGEYEGIREEILTNPDRAPDYGPARLGKAGATAIGARAPLIAYNVYLNTDDLDIAKAIARAVRHSSGGLRFVKALGMEIEERGLVQVSMNMTDYRKTPLFRAFEMIKREAARYGVSVVSSEIIGLVPQAALFDAAEYYLQIERFSSDLILEQRMASMPDVTPYDFLDAVADGTPTPGGGSAAALAGALGAALTTMVCNVTVGKKGYAEVEERMREVSQQAESLQAELTGLIERDGYAYRQVLAAYRQPKESGEERSRRQEAIQDALKLATDVPLSTARKAVQVLELARIVAAEGNRNAASDAGMAGYAAYSAVKGAALNVKINAAGLKDQALAEDYLDQTSALQERAAQLVDEVEDIVASRLTIDSLNGGVSNAHRSSCRHSW